MKYTLYLSCTDTSLNDLYYERTLTLDAENSGLDLYLPEEIIIPKPSELDGKAFMVKLKIKCEMRVSDDDGEKERNVGYYLEPRSSISKYPVSIANSHGIMDAGYRGEVMVALRNERYADEPVIIPKHTRLVQICAPTLEPITLELIAENQLSRSERGEGGFGSTGI